MKRSGSSGACLARARVDRRRAGRSALAVVALVVVALFVFWLFVPRPNATAYFVSHSPTRGQVFDEHGVPYVGGVGLRMEVVEPFGTGPSVYAQGGWTDPEGRFELPLHGLRVPVSNDALAWSIEADGFRHDIDFTTAPVELRHASGVVHLGEELIDGTIDIEPVELALPPAIGTLEVRPAVLGDALVIFVPRGIPSSSVPGEWFASARALTLPAGRAVPVYSWDDAERWTILVRAALGGEVGELVFVRDAANLVTLASEYSVVVEIDAGAFEVDSSTVFVCAFDSSVTPFAVDPTRESVRNWIGMHRHYQGSVTDTEHVNLGTRSVTLELPIGVHRLELWRQDAMQDGPIAARDVTVTGDMTASLRR
jgi:hypothetical protein